MYTPISINIHQYGVLFNLTKDDDQITTGTTIRTVRACPVFVWRSMIDDRWYRWVVPHYPSATVSDWRRPMNFPSFRKVLKMVRLVKSVSSSKESFPYKTLIHDCFFFRSATNVFCKSFWWSRTNVLCWDRNSRKDARVSWISSIMISDGRRRHCCRNRRYVRRV